MKDVDGLQYVSSRKLIGVFKLQPKQAYFVIGATTNSSFVVFAGNLSENGSQTMSKYDPNKSLIIGKVRQQ